MSDVKPNVVTCIQPAAATQQYAAQVDAANMLGVTDRTIRKWERRGLLKGKRVGGVKLYSVADLKRLAEVA